MKLVEVVRHPETASDVVDVVRGLAERFGKTAITVMDRPGFASSRLGLAIGLEAMRMVEQGVATAADIDTAMRLGFNWPLGPLELGHRLGWGRGLRELEELRGLYGEAYRPAPLLRRLAAGESLPA